MAGITAYGAYVPLWRLGRETKGWGLPAEKAVASFDEDSITMAIAAAIDCLKGLDRGKIDGLYFASTSSPYIEKQAANTIATAADLRPDAFTADFSHSLRAGTIALRAAIDAIKAGSAQQLLVAAADLRLPMSRSEFEPVFGDGGTAVLIGDSGVAAEIEDSYSISDEMLDVWRAESDSFVRTWEDRFVMEEGYLKVLPQAVSGLLKRHELTPKDFTKALFYAPNARRHGEMVRKLGFNAAQVQDPMFATVGNTGAAFALMMLVAALEEAKAGDRILLANYGNGADAFILRVTEEIDKIRNRRGIKAQLQSKKTIDDYQVYARWRGLIEIAPPVRRPRQEVPSIAALWRERDQNIRLYGVKCKECGYSQYPVQRVCAKCHAKDNFEPVRFSDKIGEVFTYAMDYLGPTPDPPLVIAIVNFEGGGRMMTQMTDRDLKEIKIGMPVEMSFRKLFYTEGVHNYYWKCMPLRT